MESLENSGRIQGEFTLNSWRIHAEFSTLRLAANEITARRNPASDAGCGSEWRVGTGFLVDNLVNRRIKVIV